MCLMAGSVLVTAGHHGPIRKKEQILLNLDHTYCYFFLSNSGFLLKLFCNFPRLLLNTSFCSVLFSRNSFEILVQVE